jgi:hypothetical protein
MTEYHALLWGLQVAAKRGLDRVIAVGDSNLVIKQVMGIHQCKSAELMVLLRRVKELETSFQLIQYVHVTRDFNAAADHVATKTLRGEQEYQVVDSSEIEQLKMLNKLDLRVADDSVVVTEEGVESPDSEVVFVATRGQRQRAARGAEVTSSDTVQSPTSQAPVAGLPPALPPAIPQLHSPPDDSTDPEVVIAERWRRVAAHQLADPELRNIIRYLEGDLAGLRQKELKKIERRVHLFELDHRGVLRAISYSPRKGEEGPELILRAVIPETL